MKLDHKGLVQKKGRYYWQPNGPERDAGWKPLGFGTDLAAAIKGADARNDAIAAWRTGGAQPRAVKKFVARDTVDHWIKRFKAEYFPRGRNGRPLAQSTQDLYSHNLVKLSAWAGPEPLAAITPKRVRELRDIMMKPLPCGACDPCTSGRKKPCAAPIVRHTMSFNVLTTGRSLMKFVKSEEAIEHNPFDGHGLAAPPPRDQVWSPAARDAIATEAARPVVIDGGTWTEDQPAETSIGVAVMLGFSVAQREGDILKLPITAYVEIPEHKLRPEDFEILRQPHLSPDGVVRGIRVRQGKTRRWVEVPIVGAMRAAVEANIARAKKAGLTTILFDDRTMQPWGGRAGQQRFQERFARLRERATATAAGNSEDELAAELRDIRFQDLRRTAVVYYGELNLADQLIAAITGHELDTTRKILETYMPRTTSMAGSAVAISHARDAKAAKLKEQSA